MQDIATSDVGLCNVVCRQSICWPPVTLIAWQVIWLDRAGKTMTLAMSS